MYILCTVGILVGIGVTIIVLLVLGMVILGIVVVILYHKLKEQTELVNDCKQSRLYAYFYC